MAALAPAVFVLPASTAVHQHRLSRKGSLRGSVSRGGGVIRRRVHINGLRRTTSLRRQRSMQARALARSGSLMSRCAGFPVFPKLHIRGLERAQSLSRTRSLRSYASRDVFGALSSELLGGGPQSLDAEQHLRRTRSHSATSRKSSRLRHSGSCPSRFKVAAEAVVTEAVDLAPPVVAANQQVLERSYSNQRATAAATDTYNEMMKKAMKSPYEYHHEHGIYYTRILDNLIVGSQPQTPQDVDRLFFEEGVTAIINLQQDHDITYWNVDIGAIQHRAKELGVAHIRRPAKDFDGNSLRQQLPAIVAMIDKLTTEGHKVYIHCTAGLGRAPGAAIAYLFWYKNMGLDEAYAFLTSKRPCGPNKDAIRGATFDVVKGPNTWERFEHLSGQAFTGMASWERDLLQQRVRSLWMLQ